MDNYSHAADVLRRQDRDRYLADLYAPEAARKHLFALHALAAEIARVREMVSEPMLGEIRLQWWRDALTGNGGGGHPVATAAAETVKAFNLPRAALDMLAEAHIFDLYDDPMPTMGDIEGYAGETTSAVLQLSAIVLSQGRDPGSADASGHAGVAEAMVAILRGLLTSPASTVKYLPEDLMSTHRASRQDIAARRATPPVVAAIGAFRERARQHLEMAEAAVQRLPATVAPVFLPLAVAAARLDRLDRSAADPFNVPDVPAWRRQWLIWRSARRRDRPAA